MTTPVLTKNQQRHSLSAKKGPIKGLRNILAQPDQNFWPLINVNQCPKLITNLNTILPSIKQSNGRMPLNVIKTIPKKDRALARKEMLEKTPPKPDKLKFMIMGINAVTRALEKDDICSVLLDANVDPPLIIKHIITMAVNKKVPILLLPNLKKITLEKIEFATAAFALKQEVMQCPDNVCHLLYKSIAEAFKTFKLPECSLQHIKSEEMPDKSIKCEAKITGVDSVANPNILKQEKPVTVLKDVYLYRSSRDKRVFIPTAVNQSSSVSKTPSDEFIALGSDLDFVDDKNCGSTSKKQRYIDIGKEEKHTQISENTEKNQSFNKLKAISNNADSTKHTKNILKRSKNDEPDYLPLKIKRIQGTNKRKKATKFSKKKKCLSSLVTE